MKHICVFDEKGEYKGEGKTHPALATLQSKAELMGKLTWSIKTYSKHVPNTKKQEKAIKRAFLRIGLVIPQKFKFERNNLNADIVIEFSDDDPYFKQHKSALAYAFVGTTSQPIDIVFNDSNFFWAINTDAGPNQYKIEPVAVHEILHVLGVGHNPTCSQCIMYNSYNKTYSLHDKDIKAVQDIWGKRTGFARLRMKLWGYLLREL